MWQFITASIILALPFIVIVYDVIAGHFGGRESTITAVIQWYAVRFPELPAAVAALFVWLWLHLFLSGIMESVNRRHPPEQPALIKNGHNGVHK